MTRKRRTSEELDAALRAAPEYQELCQLLSRQTEGQKERLEGYLSQQCEVSHGTEETMSQEDTKPPVIVRIIKLRDGEGLSFEKVANRLNDEGYLTQAGGPFVAQRVRKRYLVEKKRRESQVSQPCEPDRSSLDQADSSDTSQPCERLSGHEEVPAVCEPSQPCETSAASPAVEIDAKLANAEHSKLAERVETANFDKLARDERSESEEHTKSATVAILARSSGSERADDMQVANTAKLARDERSESGERIVVANLADVARDDHSERADHTWIANTAKLAKDDRSEQADDTGIANIGNVATAERAEQEDDMGKVVAKPAKSENPEHSEPGDDTRLAKAAMVANDARTAPTKLERANAAKLATFDESADACEKSQPCEPVAPVVTSCETCELSHGTIPVAILRELRDMVREEIETMQSAIPANAAKPEGPPPIPRVKGGRKFLGERVTLSGTRIDKNLFDAYERERAESGLSASDLMQRVLWQRYKVKLSFED